MMINSSSSCRCGDACSCWRLSNSGTLRYELYVSWPSVVRSGDFTDVDIGQPRDSDFVDAAGAEVGRPRNVSAFPPSNFVFVFAERWLLRIKLPMPCSPRGKG